MTPYLRTDGPIGGHLPRTDKPAVVRFNKFVVDDPTPGWRDEAACRDHPEKELWFPIGNTGPALRMINAAKRICESCPVRQDCLTWALDAGEDAGVWGGLSEDERRNLKRRVKRAEAKQAAA